MRHKQVRRSGKSAKNKQEIYLKFVVVMQSRAPLLGLAKSICNSMTKVTVILKAFLKIERFSRCVSGEAKLDYF